MNKICSKCKCEKSQTEFSKDKLKKDGLSTQCKACKSKYLKSWTTNNKKLKAALDRDYRNKNLIKIKAQKRIYYLNNLEHIHTQCKKNYKANKTIYLKRQKEWVLNNPDKVAFTKKAYKLRRRAKECLDGGITTSKLRAFISSELNICCYCQKPFIDGKYHVDHVEPLAKGGKHVIENLALTCPSCNLSKHTRSVIVFMAIRHTK